MEFIEHPLAGPVLRIAHADSEALVSPLGAQVVSWRHRGREMLWLSQTRLEGKPLRGGIPICWPWFGPHPTDPAQPAHGVARMAEWTIDEMFPDRASLKFKHDGLMVNLIVAIGDCLALHLTTANAGPGSATITAALHTYLAVDDIAQVRVTGLEGAPYIDKVDDAARSTQKGELRFEAEVDRIFTTGGATLHDGERALKIDNDRSSRTLVAWNPWTAKSARLGDMSPDDYRRMVCLETAWAGDESRTLLRHTNATLITILRPLAASP